MSWLSDLYETYEQNFDMDKLDFVTDTTPIPISHTTQNSQIEVTIDNNGDFIHAEAIYDKEQALTIIPVSEDSAARTSGPCAHPLEDKLEYIAGDFQQYTGKDNKNKHQLYMEALSNWCDSDYSCSEIQAIRTYVSKRHVIKDLVCCGVLKLSENGDKLTNDKIAGIDQRKSFIRFSVSGGNPDAVYRNKRIFDLYTKYYESLGGEKDFCFVSGEYSRCSQKHGAKIRSGGDKAKLISANDSTGFTYRGRFSNQSQALSVGYDVSQKAHSALRWLVKKNGFNAGEMTVVSWEISGKDIPDIMTENVINIFDEDMHEDSNEDNINTRYARKLKDTVNGYKRNLGDNSNIVVMGLEAATDGRLSIRFYNKMRGSDFIDNIERWYSICCWRWNDLVGTPSLYQIATSIFGRKNGEFLRSTVERLLPCIIENRSVPQDIVRQAVNTATNPNSFEKYREWQQAIGIACSLIRKMEYDRSGDYNGEKRKEWSMALDKNESDRSYLFGRLLASAQKVEEMALFIAGQDRRITSAERYYQQFQMRPVETWKVVRNSLQPYVMKLKNTGAYKYVEDMEGICSQIAAKDFMKKDRLSELFLLGYSCQINSYKEEK